MRALVLFSTLFVAGLVSTGCPTPITVSDSAATGCAAGDTSCVACTFDTDCPNGGVCTEAGTCGAALPTGGDGGAGGGGGGGSGGDCTQTTDCAISEMCNGATHACADLPDGWCRQ